MCAIMLIFDKCWVSINIWHLMIVKPNLCVGHLLYNFFKLLFVVRNQFSMNEVLRSFAICLLVLMHDLVNFGSVKCPI
jgi:hypothetical protein